MREFLKTTLIGGGLVVVPIAVLIAVAVRLATGLRDAFQPVADALQVHTAFPAALAAGCVIGLCFATGLFVRTRIGDRIAAGFERMVLARVPGFALLKNISRRMIGDTEGTAFASALLETDDGIMIAFIVEEHSDNRFTVFVPAVPTPATGELRIVPGERVHRIDVPLRKLIQCIGQWGAGADELVRALDRLERKTIEQRAAEA